MINLVQAKTRSEISIRLQIGESNAVWWRRKGKWDLEKVEFTPLGFFCGSGEESQKSENAETHEHVSLSLSFSFEVSYLLYTVTLVVAGFFTSKLPPLMLFLLLWNFYSLTLWDFENIYIKENHLIMIIHWRVSVYHIWPSFSVLDHLVVISKWVLYKDSFVFSHDW